jgi:hypothetical protein
MSSLYRPSYLVHLSTVVYTPILTLELVHTKTESESQWLHLCRVYNNIRGMIPAVESIKIIMWSENLNGIGRRNC